MNESWKNLVYVPNLKNLAKKVALFAFGAAVERNFRVLRFVWSRIQMAAMNTPLFDGCRSTAVLVVDLDKKNGMCLIARRACPGMRMPYVLDRNPRLCWYNDLDREQFKVGSVLDAETNMVPRLVALALRALSEGTLNIPTHHVMVERKERVSTLPFVLDRQKNVEMIRNVVRNSIRYADANPACVRLMYHRQKMQIAIPLIDRDYHLHSDLSLVVCFAPNGIYCPTVLTKSMVEYDLTTPAQIMGKVA